ncbi:zinc finger C2HC domain-containing protein 1C [Diorhabda carinulata]|uniref:zinc finger C2HC domain-containing protein 1C n=1 Tax=Diorhabda carinulata TaxID=1163345 RepID=UPI0025A04794|nr:zinc finger C2HC domain-containing protein 1C [Diorhabda carinulata]
MTSKLVQMQARFQQRQMQEKEEKLLKLYENQQQRAFDKIGRGSAGSNDSLPTTNTGGKVRQMFDERRQKAGIDKSYPLEPLKSKNNSRGLYPERKTTVRATVQNSTTVIKNGKPLVKKKEVVNKVYENINGKETFEEIKYVNNGDNENHSKSHREIIEIDNNNKIDGIENEKMPLYDLDEGDNDNALVKSNKNNNSNLITKKMPTNNNAAYIKQENHQKNNLTNVKRTSTKQTASPLRNSTPNSPVKKTSNTGMQDKSKTTVPRAPSSTRPSAKQQSPRTVVNRDDLTECTYCGRRFAEDRIEKHEDVCSKTGKKKRKIYDATKHRVLGTELESYVLKGPRSKINNKSLTRTVPKKDWRRTHEEFISAIRAAKEAQAHLSKGGKLSDLPPPPPSSNPDYVQCPHCGRRFNQAAAERHIPKCADYQFNKPKPGTASKSRIQKK